jgi:hypothetical protein
MLLVKFIGFIQRDVTIAIGTVCFNGGEDNTISCVDALGATAASFPSATTGIVPSATPVLASDPWIVYTPPREWSSSKGASCTTNDLLYNTETLNATVSFNYSGEHNSHLNFPEA